MKYDLDIIVPVFREEGNISKTLQEISKISEINNRILVIYDFDEVDPYISQINHFIDVINKKVDPITNASDAKRTLKVALSILESAKLSSIIKI